MAQLGFGTNVRQSVKIIEEWRQLVLILSRKEDQSIVFPNCGITIHMLAVQGRTTKIGVEAPQHVSVLRGELVDISAPPLNSGTRAPQRRPTDDSVNSAETSVSAYEDHPRNLQGHLQRLARSAQLYYDLKAIGQVAQAESVLEQLLSELVVLDRCAATCEHPVRPVVAESATTYNVAPSTCHTASSC